MKVVNKYDGRCKTCGGRVAAGQGFAVLDKITDQWRTEHREGQCLAAVDRDADKPMTKIDASDEAVDKVITLIAGKLAAELVPELVTEKVLSMSRSVEISIPKLPKVKIDTAHKMLPTVLQAVVAGAAPFLVGPAGSGKTTLGEQIAKALNLDFYMAARVTSEYKLVGFTDANGKCVRTPFREWYEKGGVFLFDEVDASDADALTAFNAGLANGHMEFPDGLVKRHKDAHAIAAGNTFGRGADRQYVGRQQLDAATLDRFVILEVDYDEELELSIVPDRDWVRHVQKIRAAVDAEKIRHIVSPRASIVGARLLAAGMDRALVEDACIWKGLDEGSKRRIQGRLA